MPEEKNETSTDVFGNEAEEDTAEETENKEELAGEDTPEKTTELDSAKTALAESQERTKRYKEQVSGSQAEAERLKKENEELKTQIPIQEPDLGLTPEDRQYVGYLKDKLKMVSIDEADRIAKEKVAPLLAAREADIKTGQTRIIKAFIAKHSDLDEQNDPDGVKLGQVTRYAQKFYPVSYLNPNDDLEERLEDSYYLAFRAETNREALSKAKEEGRAEGHEASDTKVGEGASISSHPAKKQRSPESENMLKRFGVDDESISKKQSETEQK